MKNLPQVFFRIFLFFSLVFTLPRLLYLLLSSDSLETINAPGINSIILNGLFGSFLASVFLIVIHVIFVRNIYRSEYGALDYGVLQSREEKVTQPLHTLFDRLVGKLSSNRWKLIEQDENKGILQFRVWDLLRFRDEIVTIQLYPENDEQTNLKIESRPNNGLRIIDIGNNLRNIQKVQQALRQ